MSDRILKIALSCIFLTWSTTANALSCNITSYEDQLEAMSNIFLARVQSAKIFPEIDFTEEQVNRQNYKKRKDRKIAVKLKIIEVFKGDSIASDYVISPNWEQTTSPVQVGESYLFSSRGKSIVGNCHITPIASSSTALKALHLLEAYSDGKLESLINVWRFGDSPGCGLSVEWRKNRRHNRDYLRHEDRGALVVRNYEYLAGKEKMLDDGYSIQIYTSNTKNIELQSSDGRSFDIEKKEKTQHQMMQWREVKGMSLAELVTLMRSEETLEVISDDVGEAKMVAPILNRWFEHSYKEFSQCVGIEE